MPNGLMVYGEKNVDKTILSDSKCQIVLSKKILSEKHNLFKPEKKQLIVFIQLKTYNHMLCKALENWSYH